MAKTAARDAHRDRRRHRALVKPAGHDALGASRPVCSSHSPRMEQQVSVWAYGSRRTTVTKGTTELAPYLRHPAGGATDGTGLLPVGPRRGLRLTPGRGTGL